MAMETWKGRYQGQIMVTWGIALVIMALEYIFWTGTYRTLATGYRNEAFFVGIFPFPWCICCPLPLFLPSMF